LVYKTIMGKATLFSNVLSHGWCITRTLYIVNIVTTQIKYIQRVFNEQSMTMEYV